jgi:hypothetical protein
LDLIASLTCACHRSSNGYFEFAGYLYARFKGDYRETVKLLKLQADKSKGDEKRAHFVSSQAPQNACPPTIMLTPLENGEFLLGCGWCNGG